MSRIANFRTIIPARQAQKGQALIYGLFFLLAGLSGLFFLFNTGQLLQEKTKLVNTADAVAYSAGLMQARAMNFTAYTNRALVANEMAIAQMVSLSSWSKYLVEHGENALTELGCAPEASFSTTEPGWKLMTRYAPLCIGLGVVASNGVLPAAGTVLEKTSRVVAMASEAAKVELKASQQVLKMTLFAQRAQLMKKVANANANANANDERTGGRVKVDLQAFRDTFYNFENSGRSMVALYKDDERKRMADLVGEVAALDPFVDNRHWRDTAKMPSACLPLWVRHDYVEKKGQTHLNGLDQWQAHDEASVSRWFIRTRRWRPPRCVRSESRLGTGDQMAIANENTNSSDQWSFYSGIPEFNDLSARALASEDPRAQFVVRLLRERNQTPTSDALSDIKNSPRLNTYQASIPSEGAYVALSAAEVYFERPTQRKDQKIEAASLVNPYWQVHLIGVDESMRQLAWARQGVR